MVKFFFRVKDSNHELAIAIKKNYEAGMRQKDIAKLFNLSKQRVNYWIHHDVQIKRKRREKLTRNERLFIIRWAKDKPINFASAKKIQLKFNRLPKSKKENGIQKKISLSTSNKTLNKYISRPKNIKKVFYLSTYEKAKRFEFLKFMKQKGITPEKIFFTDESIFYLSSYFNKNYKVRICKNTQKLISRGNEIALKKKQREIHKKEIGLMISGGICNEGLGKIIFHSGNVNTFAYRQVLNFYKEDLDNFKDKIFQQDGARAHSSKASQIEINKLFKGNFIPTWESENEISEQKIPKWPPNSPDLSAIELVWSIIKGMLNMFPPNSMEELKKGIQRIWNSITPEICKRIINHTKKRWDLCIRHKGRRLDKELLKKIIPEKEKKRIKMLKTKINGIRISYNDKFVMKLKSKDIKEKNKKLKEQIAVENNLKTKFEKMMKLKPREYMNIPDKDKKDLKFQYDHEKARRELMQEKLEEIKKMSPIEYLNVLNEETKEKLIGLCMNKKILEAYENDLFLNDEEETREIREEDEDEEEEEESEFEENI